MRAYSPATQWVKLAMTIKVFIADYFFSGVYLCRYQPWANWDIQDGV